MPARSIRRARLQLEALESRYAPATLVSPTQLTYQDLDGDAVTVTFSKPILTSATVANSIFTFHSGNVNGSNATPQQLQKMDLTTAAGVKGTDITIEVGVTVLREVDVGFLDASGRDLGKVIVQGDLGRIEAGDSDVTTLALKKLAVRSIGVRGLATQGAGGSLSSFFNGPVGKMVATGSIRDASIVVSNGQLDLLAIGGSLVGGGFTSAGQVYATSIGEIRVGGSVAGGAGEASAKILADIGIGDITIGGSLSGGSGRDSGSILSNGGNIGHVSIDGSVTGGNSGANPSGTLVASNGKIKSLFIGQGLVGGGGVGSGRVLASRGLGALEVRNDLAGGAGLSSGRVDVPEGNIGDVTLIGLLVGAAGAGSGSIVTGGSIGDINISGSIIGSAASNSAEIIAAGELGDVTIGGSLLGGTGVSSGIISASGMGNVSIAGDVRGGGGFPSGIVSANAGMIQSLFIGGSLLGGGGNQSGYVRAELGLGFLTIDESIVGGTGVNSGRVDAPQGSIGDTTVGEAISGGSGDGSGSVVAGHNLGNVFVGGSIVGTAADHVLILAGGVGSAGPAKIGHITVNGSVQFADILAGYHALFNDPSRTRADAKIGRVTVAGNWIASSLVAGVDRGADGLFGTADDGASVTGSDSFISKIGAITIDGTAQGTAGTGDHFGIVAEEVKAFSANGAAEALNPGPLNDVTRVFGPHFDLTMAELEA